ncbi:hypothetical protein QYM36_014088, partial [Artemia franciscana]
WIFQGIHFIIGIVNFDNMEELELIYGVISRFRPYTSSFYLMPCLSQQIKGSINYATAANNVFCMFAIAIERWRCLSSYKRRSFSSACAKKVVGFIWMLSISITLGIGCFNHLQMIQPLEPTFNRTMEEFRSYRKPIHQLCYLQTQSGYGYKPITTMSFNIIVGFVTPILFMSAIYTILICRLAKDVRRSRELLGAVTSTQRAKLRAIQAMVLVLALFVICWLPCHMLNLWTAIRGAPTYNFSSKVLHDASVHLAMSHHWLHTVIYPAYSRQLTNALRDTASCCFKKRYKRNRTIELQTRVLQANVSFTDLATGS